jgi:hypothetical protein
MLVRHGYVQVPRTRAWPFGLLAAGFRLELNLDLAL